MFTGLVQDVGSVTRVSRGAMTDLWIDTAFPTSELTLGESIAVDGACLTVVEVGSGRFRVQASEETLRRTTLGGLGAGAKVNLERAMRLSDRLGGHLVLGHVDEVSRILEVQREGGARTVAFSLSASLSPLFVEKGSVAVDGVSLTVNRLEADRFRVTLIPETQQRTALCGKGVGAAVNLEADLIGKYVARLYSCRADPGGLTAASLAAAGFAPRGGGA